MKRCLDIAGAVAGLVALSPLLIAVGTLVILESGLPGFFRQQRVGRGGRDFVLYKFRTMTLRHGTESGSFDAGSSTRVTRVGRILRKTKVDELPQLWNVLKGDMSLVGPRPEVRKWVDAYPARWRKVLTVRPGITDPASIVYRNEEEILAESTDPEATYREEILPHKLSLYEDYVDTRSFWGDIGILVKTVRVMMKGT
jgi:lipopolysaccharide/colanic/teichoic acid biosynthesis glycosyltransferase